MTVEQWQMIAGLIDEWWPGKFEKTAQDAWFIALEDRDAQPLLNAIKALLHRGGVHRPSLGELIGLLRSDPSVPTFDEAFHQLYGPGGVFGFKREGVTVSPWVLAFVKRYGEDRLRLLDVDNEEHGRLRRADLRVSWEEFVQVTEARELAAIAAGDRRGGMAKLDPLGALGWDRQQLEAGHMEQEGEQSA